MKRAYLHLFTAFRSLTCSIYYIFKNLYFISQQLRGVATLRHFCTALSAINMKTFCRQKVQTITIRSMCTAACLLNALLLNAQFAMLCIGEWSGHDIIQMTHDGDM